MIVDHPRRTLELIPHPLNELLWWCVFQPRVQEELRGDDREIWWSANETIGRVISAGCSTTLPMLGAWARDRRDSNEEISISCHLPIGKVADDSVGN